MVCADGVTRQWSTLLRTPTAMGLRVNSSITAASGGLWYGIAKGSTYDTQHFNPFSGTYISTPAYLFQTGSAVNNQYSFARVKLRRLRFTGRNTKMNMRFGGTWVHVGGGSLWPWDGSELPYGLFSDGGGSQPAEYEG